ncbi:MAG: hypothetical protein NC225_07335 [Clostridium sp.]|nr:hypothetical protein [Clostridium sp.]MCM1399276.1 hypothetical protein [Clostridium sp.]MCM1459764.1 hypothetical protein [Bacteroides sp.]
MNYVFYVCDMDAVPTAGHFRKMDEGREIASHIKQGLSDCIVEKYTEYDGGLIEAESVGIVVPAHRWGVSLAVFAFINNLKVSPDTYLYVTIVGETLSECSKDTIDVRLGFISSLRRLIQRRDLCSDDDIYVRCIDMPRSPDYTETLIKHTDHISDRIKCIMQGLLMYDIVCLEDCNGKREKHGINRLIAETMPKLETGSAVRRKINNVYLDDDIMAGVRLCRVM